jgi:N-acetylglucosamine-6-phosphate deacetylase
MRGFVDLQINGCWGVDFNAEHLSEEEFSKACEKLQVAGVSNFLPTIITDSVESLKKKLARVARYCRSASNSSIKANGIHLEGPFISSEPGFIGAHPPQFARPASLELAKRFLEASDGMLRLVTLAPEMDLNGQVTKWLVDKGVLVAAGHTDAGLNELKACLDQGMRLFTHFGNGCPANLPRHDNILHRVMSLRERIVVTLIADGAHLPLWLLEMSLDWFGIDRSIIVSDAISAAGLPAGIHTLGDRRVWVGDDGVPRSEDRSHFVGSGTTLDRMHAILSEQLGYNFCELEHLFYGNAASLLQITN